VLFSPWFCTLLSPVGGIASASASILAGSRHCVNELGGEQPQVEQCGSDHFVAAIPGEGVLLGGWGFSRLLMQSSNEKAGRMGRIADEIRMPQDPLLAALGAAMPVPSGSIAREAQTVGDQASHSACRKLF